MNIINKFSVEFPCWALSYLVNGDDSGITQEEKTMVDNFLSDLETASGCLTVECIQDSDYEFFTWSPVFGLACTCVYVNILLIERD